MGPFFFTVVGNKPGTPIIPISVCDYLELCSAITVRGEFNILSSKVIYVL